MLVSVIIPVFNEERHIAEIIRQIQEIKLPNGILLEIIVINDGSTDSTYSILQKFAGDAKINLLHLSDNKGKTNAVRYGISKSKGDIIIIQDADFEYNPCYYPEILESLLRRNEKIVYGSRFRGRIEKMKVINRIANFISNVTVNLLCGTSISDINTGLKAFNREVFNQIEIVSERFTFETEVTMKALRAGYKIYEIPINYIARPKSKGKKITWFEALRMYFGIFKFRYE